VHAVEENLACARSSLLLVEELLRAGCQRLVAAGTCAEYGLSRYPLEESSPTRPGTMYGAAKLAVATAAAAAARTTGAKLAWARIFYLFGPGEDRRRPVPTHTVQLLQGGTVTVENPDDVRDYLHVDDVVSALVTLADAEFSGVANVCSGVPTTQRQLLSTLAELTGGSLREPDSAPAEHSPVRTEGRATALEFLGWRPVRDLREGLSDTVAWWKARS
jgi:UDP-glucuronate decarboxylase